MKTVRIVNFPSHRLPGIKRSTKVAGKKGRRKEYSTSRLTVFPALMKYDKLAGRKEDGKNSQVPGSPSSRHY